MTLLFPLIYSAALFFLIWKAFTVMSNGWSAYDKDKKINLPQIIKEDILFILNY